MQRRAEASIDHPALSPEKSDEFASLYETNYPRIYRYVLYRIGGNRETTEDIVGDVFLKAFSAWPKFETRKDIPESAYFYRIAHNTVVDHYETKQAPFTLDDIGENNPSIPTVDGPEKEVIEALTEEDRARQLRKDLSSLPEDQRRIIELTFFEGIAGKQAAQIINKKIGNARVIKHRGLQSLGKLVRKRGAAY